MLYYSIINYTTNLKKKIIESNFNFIKKENLFIIKIKKIKKYFLNIKQVIYLSITNKKWYKIYFFNNCLVFNYSKNVIKNNIDSFFKLNLISLGILKNNTSNFKNLFLFLKNIVWSNIGFFELKDFYLIINKYSILKKNLIIESIDKIPFLTKYFIPKKVRISNTNRIRLGSYLSKNVTIMSEGYVNFNAYIEENCMIEGRVSAGVYIQNNTDIGGSCSIMGSLSGGGNNIISIGSNCLLGANSGIGISLGNNCIVEAGLYITSGVKIYFNIIKKYIYIKANNLSFVNNLTFYRNSINGRIECCKNFNFLKINFILQKN